MLRVLFIVILMGCGYSSAANANNYQDWWVYSEGNFAFSVAQQNNSMRVMGYGKTGDNTAFLIDIKGELTNNNQLTGALGTLNTGVKDAADNSATIVFSSIDTATLSYKYNGFTGSFPLKRLAFAPITANGTWDGTQTDVVQCPGAQPFITSEPVTLTVSVNAPANTIYNKHPITIKAVSGKAEVNDTGTITQDGSHLNASGSGVVSVNFDGTPATGADTYTWEAKDIAAQDYWFLAKTTQTFTAGINSGCVIKGVLTGVRHTTDISKEFNN